ncbi:MAG: hypothetical protein ACKO7R_07315 [Pseudanabaena sp.]
MLSLIAVIASHQTQAKNSDRELLEDADDQKIADVLNQKFEIEFLAIVP